MRAALSNLLKRKFIRDTITLQAGRTLSTGVTVATSILLARLLQSEGYGIYGLVFSLYELIVLFIDVGIGKATVTKLSEAYARKDQEEVINLLAFFIKLSTIIAFLVLIVGYIAAPFLASRMYGNLEIGNLVLLLLLVAPLGIIYDFVTTILQGIRMMQRLTILENLRTLITSIFVIGFLIMGLGVIGTIYGHILATFISSFIAILFYYKLRKPLGSNFSPFIEIIRKTRQIKIRQYFSFGLLISADAKINQFINLLPILLLGVFSGPREVGYFKVAVGAAYIPINILILGPLSRNLATKLPEMLVKVGSIRFKDNFFKISLYAGFISLGLTFIFVLIVPYFVRYLYGTEYIPAVKPIYILAIYIGLSGFGVGLGPFYRAIERMDIPIKVNLLGLIIACPIGLILIRNSGIIGAALFVTFWKTFYILISLLLALRIKEYKLNREESTYATQD